jgi:hypothetical protein
MFPDIKKIVNSYATSAWIPFLFSVFFLLIASILVTCGGVHNKNPLYHATKTIISFWACSLLGQLYTSFWSFFVKGTRTGTIQLLLFIVSLFISFVTFFFLLLPFWRDYFRV